MNSQVNQIGHILDEIDVSVKSVAIDISVCVRARASVCVCVRLSIFVAMRACVNLCMSSVCVLKIMLLTARTGVGALSIGRVLLGFR